MNVKKILLIIIDGLGDRPIVALNNQTPLENARTPNLSLLLERGQCGLMDPIGVGIRSASDVSLLTLLGYDYEKEYTGRGPLEALGVGLSPKEGDLCFRVNFATVDSQMKIIDRRGGRVGDFSVFEKEINNIHLENAKIIFKAGVGHRAALVLRGDGLSSKISENDSHAVGKKALDVKPLDATPEAKNTAGIVNEFVKKAWFLLKKHEENKKRIKQKLLPANYLLLRGVGFPPTIPSFEQKYNLKAVCVAAEGLYRGMARAVGMQTLSVSGATGRSDTDLVAKILTAKKNLAAHDFVLLHIKAADNLSHDGDFIGKRNFFERLDVALKELIGTGAALIVITGDHSSPCELKNHSGDPVPIVFLSEGIRKDSVKKFSERECARGGVGRIKGKDLMNEILNLSGRARLYGS